MFLVNLTAGAVESPTAIEVALKHCGRIECFTPKFRAIFCKALGEYLVKNRKDPIRPQYQYAVYEKDLDAVVQMFQENLDRYM